MFSLSSPSQANLFSHFLFLYWQGGSPLSFNSSSSIDLDRALSFKTQASRLTLVVQKVNFTGGSGSGGVPRIEHWGPLLYRFWLLCWQRSVFDQSHPLPQTCSCVARVIRFLLCFLAYIAHAAEGVQVGDLGVRASCASYAAGCRFFLLIHFEWLLDSFP